MLQSSKSIYWCSGPTLTASLLLYKINLSCVCFPSLARRAQDDTFLCKGCALHSPGQQPTVSQTPATVAHGAESSSPSRTQPTHPSPADAEGGSSSSSACHSNDLWTLCLKATGALINTQECESLACTLHLFCQHHPSTQMRACRECTALLGSLEVKPLAAMGHWLSIVTHFPFILAHEPLDLFLHSMET